MSDSLTPNDPSASDKVAQPAGVTGPPAESGVVEPGSGVTAPESGKRPTWFWWAIVGGVLILGVLLFLLLGRAGNVTVPQAVGLPQQQAEATITAAGLSVGTVSTLETVSVAPGTVVKQAPGGGEKVPERTDVDLTVASLPVVKVPDIVGKTVSEATAELAAAGLQPGDVTYDFSTSVDAGKVIAQEPAAGSDASVGAYVSTSVSKGEKQEQVPNVVGLSQADAEDVLKAAGFDTRIIKSESSSVPAGDVVAQSPAAGTAAASGSTVTLTVSAGAPETPPTPEPPASGSGDQTTSETPEAPATPPDNTKPPEPNTAAVPNVIGMRVLEGIREIRQAQLTVDFAFGPSDEFVLRIAEQNPAAGTDVERGSTVTITIGLPTFLFDPTFAPEKPTQPIAPVEPQAEPSGTAPSPPAAEPETTAP